MLTTTEIKVPARIALRVIATALLALTICGSAAAQAGTSLAPASATWPSRARTPRASSARASAT